MRGWKLAVVVVLVALTCGGQTAVTSHDGQWTVSVRAAANGSDELWIEGRQPDHARLLSTARKFTSPQFSPDDSHIYVLAEIGPATRVLQRVEVATGVSSGFLKNATRFAFLESGPNRGRMLVAQEMQCFIEDLRHTWSQVILWTFGQPTTGKTVAKDDAEFDELLQRLSR
jgi:hypothetical protein